MNPGIHIEDPIVDQIEIMEAKDMPHIDIQTTITQGYDTSSKCINIINIVVRNQFMRMLNLEINMVQETIDPQEIIFRLRGDIMLLENHTARSINHILREISDFLILSKSLHTFFYNTF